jgi:hypothetical protein
MRQVRHRGSEEGGTMTGVGMREATTCEEAEIKKGAWLR